MSKNSTATEKLNRYVRDSGGNFGKAVLDDVLPDRLYELSLLEKIAGVSPKPATAMIEAPPTPVIIAEEPEPEPTPTKAKPKSKSKQAKS